MKAQDISTDSHQQTPEDLAMAFMEAVRPKSSSWLALHFNISKLQHYNQADIMLENTRIVLQRGFSGHEFKLFTLSNNDVVIFIKDIGLIKIESVVMEMRKLFGEDPLVIKTTGQEHFYKTFHLNHGFESLTDLLHETRNDAHHTGVNYGEQPPLSSVPMLPFETLVKLQNTLRHADISNFIRRQGFYSITSETSIKRIGCEFFLSLEGIENVIDADSHIISDFALFKYLSVLFDKKLLAYLASQMKYLDSSWDIHINLNMRSIISKDFFDFHKKISPRRITIEIDRTDILWDQEGFNFAVDFLKGYRHHVCMDLLSATNLKFFTGSDVVCDSYKIIADPDLFKYHMDDLTAFVEDKGASKIIFARCESPHVIKEGLKLGVNLYQGRYLDQITAPKK